MRCLFPSVIAICLIAPINAKALVVDLQLGTHNNGIFVPFPAGAEIVAPGFFDIVIGLSASEFQQNVAVPTNILGIKYDIVFTNELNGIVLPVIAANFVANVGFGCVNAFIPTGPGIQEFGRKCTVTALFNQANPFLKVTNNTFGLFDLTFLGGNNAVRDGRLDLGILGNGRHVFLPNPPPAPGGMINTDNLTSLELPSSNSIGIDLVPVPGPIPFLGVVAFFRYSRKIRRLLQIK
jgi:hypothetical protein